MPIWHAKAAKPGRKENSANQKVSPFVKAEVPVWYAQWVGPSIYPFGAGRQMLNITSSGRNI